MKLNINKQAPTFSLPDQNNNIVCLSDFYGKWILLYFYPKDDTPGCTKEACEIRDVWSRFKKAGIEVFGVSVDSVKSHQKFLNKYKLPFTLLADEDKKVVKLYGVWGKKKFMGREYFGVKRESFLLNPKGKIVKIYDDVKPAEHAKEVLTDVKELNLFN